MRFMLSKLSKKRTPNKLPKGGGVGPGSAFVILIYKLHCRSLGGLRTNNKCLFKVMKKRNKTLEIQHVFVCIVYSRNYVIT